MSIVFLILLLGLLSWKGYLAWKRGRNTYVRDREQYQSLWEYLVVNGATEREARKPFLARALTRAFMPLMRQWRFWVVVGVLVVLTALTACAQNTDYVEVRTTQKATALQRYAYKAWYSESYRIPLAVSWYLTKEHTYGRNQRKQQTFQPDPDIRNAVTTYDYMQSGYDRGHMCPAGDNKWSQQAQEQTFYLTNICPQNHNLNKNDWNDLEQLCRQWARKYGKIYIVCGPVLRGSNHKQIGPRQRRITVPEAFYKVVLRLGKNPTAIGFVYDNKGQSQPMREAVCTVDEIERLTGLDFFSALDDKTESRIESHSSLADW